MSGLNTLIRLPAADSTNAWAKANLDRFGPVGAVYTTNQTAGRGRLGRAWANAAGQALYYTAVLRLPLADPGALPLYASLAVAAALRRQYGADCQIKWPNDLLLHGKKIVGILCESCQSPEPGGPRAILCGIGVNLAQPAEYFAQNGLPHATSTATSMRLSARALPPAAARTKPPVSTWAAMSCTTAARARPWMWTRRAALLCRRTAAARAACSPAR